ncbi:MAG: NAD(P)H-hydrate dehydratase [Bacteroides sp.]|nr:NAD(P)H-hydrate dehydratase [Bacteroides sp.]
MKIFTSNIIRSIDTATCDKEGIPSIALMERAASVAADEIISRFPTSQRFVVIAGPGDNGGDALAIARILLDNGYKKVEVFLFNVNEKLSRDCDEERKKLITIDGVDFTEVRREFSPPYIGPKDVVIDGLFGSGLSKSLKGGFVSVARLINESGAFVISIDVPSGLYGEFNDNVNPRDIVHANLTLTFEIPRLAFFFAENADVIGEWKLLNIDLDKKTKKDLPSDYILVEARTIRAHLLPRRPFTGKRDYGSALLFAGSTGMMGAAVMCAGAVLRSGAGLVTVHSANSGINILQTSVPEAMFEPDRNEHFISDMKVHHPHQVVAVGPGIGTNDMTVNALESLLKTAKCPLLLDADALNCLAKRPALLDLLPPKTVITPHIGEFDRMFGEQRNSEERLRKAIEMARYYNIIIVLKGHYTATVRPTGRVYFNSTGNPGMATAGAGDVLTGVIASFMAQGYCPEHAATIGVYVHGLAGDLASARLGEYGMIASDISANVGRAIRMVIDCESIPSKLQL